LAFLWNGWLTFAGQRRRIEHVFPNERHGSATLHGGYFVPKSVAHFIPEYPIWYDRSWYNNDALRRLIMGI
jgi:hypothetical protein